MSQMIAIAYPPGVAVRGSTCPSVLVAEGRSTGQRSRQALATPANPKRRVTDAARGSSGSSASHVGCNGSLTERLPSCVSGAYRRADAAYVVARVRDQGILDPIADGQDRIVVERAD